MFLNQKETSFCTSYLANFGLMMTSFFRNLDASVELCQYQPLSRRNFFLFLTEWYSFFLWVCFFFVFFFFVFFFLPRTFFRFSFSTIKDFFQKHRTFICEFCKLCDIN